MRAVVPFYGVYDFSDHYGLQAQKTMSGFLERMVMKDTFSANPDAYKRASPMHRIHTDAPPFFIIHGTNDSLISVEEARHFSALLRQASKSPVAYAEIPGAQHAFEIFHSIRTSCTDPPETADAVPDTLLGFAISVLGEKTMSPRGPAATINNTEPIRATIKVA